MGNGDDGGVTYGSAEGVPIGTVIQQVADICAARAGVSPMTVDMRPDPGFLVFSYRYNGTPEEHIDALLALVAYVAHVDGGVLVCRPWPGWIGDAFG